MPMRSMKTHSIRFQNLSGDSHVETIYLTACLTEESGVVGFNRSQGLLCWLNTVYFAPAANVSFPPKPHKILRSDCRLDFLSGTSVSVS